MPVPLRLSRRPVSRPFRGLTAVVAAGALVVAGLAGGGRAHAASVTSAAFSGGAGTFTAANGTVYAKQGAALTLTVNTDDNTQCVDVIDGTGTTIATQTSGRTPERVDVHAALRIRG